MANRLTFTRAKLATCPYLIRAGTISTMTQCAGSL